MSSSNPFDNVGNDQFLGESYGSNENDYVDDNPFDTYFKIQDKQKEEVLKQVLSLAQKNDPNRIGKAQILAQELNIPPDMALDSEGVLEILEERKKQQEIAGTSVCKPTANENYKRSKKIHCFVISHHFEKDFSHETYLDL